MVLPESRHFGGRGFGAEPAGPTAPAPLQGCYLICLDQPYFHARHYVGFSDDIQRRIQTHRKGQGSPLLAARETAS